MKKLVVNIKQKSIVYSILLNDRLLKKALSWLPGYGRIVIITEHNVKKFLGNAFYNDLAKNNNDVLLFSFKAGEQNKTQATKLFLEKKLLQHQCDRDTLILALGGGVVGDVAGFVAATYLRGISYIHIPTTLLAMIDSSIGGKTGINLKEGKNLIGAFWPPLKVIIDVTSLHTLPILQLQNGLFEVLKIFLIYDQKAFSVFCKESSFYLQKETKYLVPMIEQAIKLKLRIVKKDPYDTHLRNILNFGHTIGHALEKVSHYQLLHGVAVGFGMLIEAKIALLLGVLDKKSFFLIEKTLLQLGLKKEALKKFSSAKILAAILFDKKRKKDHPCYVLLQKIGKVYTFKKNYTHVVAKEIVQKALRYYTGVKGKLK